MDIKRLGSSNFLKEGHRCHGSCGTLSRLSDELLGKITFHLMRMTTAKIDPYSAPKEPRPSYDGWMVVCQVCHRCRQAALSTPRLWTTITLPCNATSLKAVNQRSEGLPLTVIIDGTPLANKEPLKEGLVRKVALRTKYLQLSLGSEFSYEVLDAFSSPSTNSPLLEVLSVKLYTTRDSPSRPTPVNFNSSHPNLRHLAYDCEPTDHHISPELPILKQLLAPSLTSLTLSRLRTCISVSTFLDILATLPKLQHLVLGEVLSSPHGVPLRVSSPDRLVHLSHIRTIRFEGVSNQWRSDINDEKLGKGEADLLQHLAIPSSAKISFTAGMYELYPPLLGFICGVLRDAVTGRATTVIGPPPSPVTHCYVTLSIFSGYTLEVAVELYSSTERTDGRDLEGTSVRKGRRRPKNRVLQVRFLTGRLNFVKGVDRVLAAFGAILSNITTLSFEGHVEETYNDDDEDEYMDKLWPRIRRTMPRLQNLTLLGHSADFIRWMVPSPFGLNSGFEFGRRTMMPMFPHLESLEVDASEGRWREFAIESFVGGPWAGPDEAVVDTGGMNGLAGALVTALQLWRDQFDDRRRLPRLTLAYLNADDIGRDNLMDILGSRVADSVRTRRVNPYSHWRCFSD